MKRFLKRFLPLCGVLLFLSGCSNPADEAIISQAKRETTAQKWLSVQESYNKLVEWSALHRKAIPEPQNILLVARINELGPAMYRDWPYGMPIKSAEQEVKVLHARPSREIIYDLKKIVDSLDLEKQSLVEGVDDNPAQLVREMEVRLRYLLPVPEKK